jgi:hypothetical protein
MDTDITKANTGQPVELQKLITAAFNDVLTANGKMAMQQMQFVLDTCFTKNGDEYTAKTVKMEVANQILAGAISPQNGVIDIPLLAIVPLNALAFDSINIDFDLDITAVTNQQNVETDNDNTSIFVKVNKAPQAGTADTSANRLNVSVKASQIPFPPGLTTFLDGLMKSIHVELPPQS